MIFRVMVLDVQIIPRHVTVKHFSDPIHTWKRVRGANLFQTKPISTMVVSQLYRMESILTNQCSQQKKRNQTILMKSYRRKHSGGNICRKNVDKYIFYNSPSNILYEYS